MKPLDSFLSYEHLKLKLGGVAMVIFSFTKMIGHSLGTIIVATTENTGSTDSSKKNC